MQSLNCLRVLVIPVFCSHYMGMLFNLCHKNLDFPHESFMSDSKRLAYYIWSVLKGIGIQYRIIISKEVPVKFFQSLTCVIIYVDNKAWNHEKIIVVIHVFPVKTRIGGHKVNFNEITQNCLNRKGPGQVLNFMRRQFSFSIDL